MAAALPTYRLIHPSPERIHPRDRKPGSFYDGVTFSQFLLGPSVTGGTGIRTLVSPSASIESSLTFATPITGAALLSRDKVPTRLSIYLGSKLVETFNTDAAGYETQRYYGFVGVEFDKLVLTQDSAAPDVYDRFYAIDRLQLSAVPIPSASILFLSGIAVLMRRAVLAPSHRAQNAGRNLTNR